MMQTNSYKQKWPSQAYTKESPRFAEGTLEHYQLYSLTCIFLTNKSGNITPIAPLLKACSYRLDSDVDQLRSLFQDLAVD